MSQNTLQVHQIEVNGWNEKTFIDFLNIDSDFHDDSKEISKELFEEFKDAINEVSHQEAIAMALECASYKSIDGSTHIVGNDTYTSDYDVTVICTDADANEYTVIVSLMLKS